MSGINYVYDHVNSGLLSGIFDGVCRGTSSVLLGHHYSGKGFLVKKLEERLLAVGLTVESMKLPNEDPAGATPQELFHELRRKHAHRKSWVLIASEVDALQHSEARRLLEEIRAEGDKGRVQAIVTGQFDLRELISGPKSELTNADHYVLEGLDELFSVGFADEVVGSLVFEGQSSTAMHKEIWKLAGGNTFLIRALLWALVQHQHRNKLQGEMTASHVRDSIAPPYQLEAVCAELLQKAIRLIEGDPGCWENLQKLIGDVPAPLRKPNGPPGALTLSGVAIRQDGHLRFSSELMEGMIRRRFHSRRIADLYARIGRWDEAFQRYSAISPKPHPRPDNRDDRSDVAATVEALSVSLHSEASAGPVAVCKRFSQGCRLLLGFSEVTFWALHNTWLPHLRDESEPTEKARCAALTIPTTRPSGPGIVPLAPPWEYYGLAAVLDAIRLEDQNAVLVGDFQDQEPVPPERRKLAEKLLDHFIKAYSHAVSVERARQRLATRDRHAQIVISILDAMGSHLLDIGQIITKAASSLRLLGYSRVLFCLVDADRQRIRGFHDDSADPTVDLAAEVDYPLAEPESDIQAFVASTGQAMIVHDVEKERLANKEVARRCGTTSFAIVPIKDINGHVVGTIHVERADQLAPANEESVDLELFARQLSTALQHGERVQLMQATLDRLPDPILIVNPQKRLRYANDAAGKVFGVGVHWHAPAPIPEQEKGLIEAATDAIRTGAHFRHVEELARKEYKGDLNAQRIVNWRNDCVGAFLHIHDLNEFHRVLTAFGHVAAATDTESALEHLLNAARTLDHPWVRVYFVDPTNPKLLRSAKGRGFDGEDTFNQGKTVLAQGTACGDRGWRCMKGPQPILYCFDPDSQDLSEDQTPLGIPMYRVSVQDEDPVLLKKPGDHWLDFPLFTKEGKKLGKLTLGCSTEISRQEFDALNALSAWFGGILEAFLERGEKQRWIQEAATISMATMAHNMNTRFSSLGLLLARYRRGLESGTFDLGKLNDEFGAIYKRIAAVALAAKKKLGVVKPEMEICDVEMILRAAFAANLQEEDWSVEPNPGNGSAIADPGLLEEVFEELIFNAKKASSSTEILRMTGQLSIEGDILRIQVRDYGPGVRPEHKEKIFDRFFYTYAETNRQSQGLGLSWVRSVLEAHGGRIKETGVYGQGACFSIELPRSSSGTAIVSREAANV